MEAVSLHEVGQLESFSAKSQNTREFIGWIFKFNFTFCTNKAYRAIGTKELSDTTALFNIFLETKIKIS